MIVACSDNRVIGSDSELPWRLPADLRSFKALTMGKPIVMGRKTYQSIGRPLPGRRNIVITRQAGFEADGCWMAQNPQQALAIAGAAEEVMIIGGGEIYRQFLAETQTIYLTEVHATIEGDTYFPELVAEDWYELSRVKHTKDEKNQFDYSFVVLERRSG